MTAERDGKSRRTGQPDLLASLPDERQVPGIDPAAIEELLTRMRDLGEQVAGLKEAVSAERPAPVTLDDLREQFAEPREAEPTEGPAPVTLEALEARDDKLVARVAEAAATRIKRMEDAAEKAAAAAERIDGVLASTADRVMAKIEGAVTTMNEGLAKTRPQVIQQSRQSDPTLGGSRTRTAGPRFGRWMGFACLFFFVFGLLVESRAHLFYLWLWAG